MYYALRRNFYWRLMAVYFYATDASYAACARKRLKLRRHSSQMNLFPAVEPFEMVAIDILSELIRSRWCNGYVLVITDRCNNLVQIIPLKFITSAETAEAFVKNFVFLNGPPEKLLSDIRKQFTSKTFQDICQIRGVENLFTTTYQPQENGQVERFNRTLLHH